VLVLIGFSLFAALMLAVLVARYAYVGPCPRCGRPIRKGQLDCMHCGCCGTR
jgi:hypothetical protein